MKITNLFLSLSALFVTSVSFGGALNCTGAAFLLNNQAINDVQDSVIVSAPAHTGAGVLEARPSFHFGKDYVMETVIRVNDQINPALPVGLFNDYSLWINYQVYKIENGKKRALADTMAGTVTATASRQSILGCEKTVCLDSVSRNVDVSTFIASLPKPMTPFEAVQQGLLDGQIPSAFYVRCLWQH